MSSLTLKELVITGTLWVGFDRWATQILSFSIYVLLARLVGPTSFGVVALAGVYVAFTQVFANQGFREALVQRRDLDVEHLDSAFWVNMTLATVLAITTILFADQLAMLFGEPQLSKVLRWLSGLLVLQGISTIPQAVLVREMSFRALTMRSLLATLAGGIVGLGMAWGGFGVWSLVGQQLSSAMIGAATLWWATPWRPSLHISKRHLRNLYGFSTKSLGNELLWFGSQRADQTLIGVAFGASTLGAYAIAMRSITIFRDLVVGPVDAVAFPTFSKLQDEQEGLRNAFYKLTEVVAGIMVPVFCGLAALAPSIVPTVFGTQWSSAIPFFQILALYGLATVPVSFGHPLMIATGRPGACLLLYLLQSCLTLGFCLLAMKWGPLPVAFAVPLAMLVYSVVFLSVCRKLVGISFRVLFFRLWAPALLAIVMFVAVYAFQALASERLGGSITTIAGCLLGVAIYFAGMVLLRPELLKQLMQDCLFRFARPA